MWKVSATLAAVFLCSCNYASVTAPGPKGLSATVVPNDCGYVQMRRDLETISGRKGRKAVDEDGRSALDFGSLPYDRMVDAKLVKPIGTGARHPVSFDGVRLSREADRRGCASHLTYYLTWQGAPTANKALARTKSVLPHDLSDDDYKLLARVKRSQPRAVMGED